jgi:phenylacetic acid degradation operon negative regulatory protein
MQDSNTERPLTARSVLASILLGTRPPELSAQRLVRAGELFGLAEGTTRVALSRMVATGELTADDGRYRLAGPLLARQQSQERSRRPVGRTWDGAWAMAVLDRAGARSPAERIELRRALSAARLAEWREGVWVRPDNLAGIDRHPSCTWLTARLVEATEDAALAARLWDLDGWAVGAARLRSRMAVTIDQLESGDAAALAPCFVTAAAVVRHLQADPLLPVEVLPSAWPGLGLRADYDDYEAAYQTLLRSVLRGLAR